MNHYRSTIKQYRSSQKKSGCPFCNPDTVAHAVKQTKHFYIVPNLTKYDLWELHDVTEHLLVIPRRHVKTLKELGPTERLELMDQLAEYEAEGYSVYARGVGFVKRSVEHQHTHLIKATNKKPKMSIFIQKPYWLLKV